MPFAMKLILLGLLVLGVPAFFLLVYLSSRRRPIAPERPEETDSKAQKALKPPANPGREDAPE